MAEMSSELRASLARHAGEPDHRESVIVTLRPGAGIEDVDGLVIRSTARAGTILMGSLNAGAGRVLATHPDVVRIERDAGDMRALDD